MKKTKGLKIAFALLFCLVFVLSSVSCKKGGEAIKIEKMPLRTVYYIGEAPDLEGMKLSVKTENGRDTVDATTSMLDKNSKLIFTKKGNLTLTAVYNGLSVSFTVFVDDDLESHRIYALSYLSSWAEDKLVTDEVTASCIDRAKQLISESETHEEIAAHLNNAKDYTYLYSEGVRYKEKLDKAKKEAKTTLLAFDFTPYTLDYGSKIVSLIEEALSDIEKATKLEDVEATLVILNTEAENMKSDEKNEIVRAFEETFKSVYEKKAAFFPESEYKELISKLIEAEASIRNAESDEAAEALSKDFFEKAENTFLTYPDVIYKKISDLKKNELVFEKDKTSLDEIAIDIFTFVYNLDGDFFVDTKAFEGIKDLVTLADDDSFKMLRSYATLSEYETKIKKHDLISEALALYDDYKLLESASKESASVINAIDAIGKVTLDSNAKIETARSTYNAWSERYSIDKNSANAFMISNYEKLEKAEKDIKALPEKAKVAADKVRAIIKALLEKEVIYSDESLGVGDQIEEAKKAYQDWIDTFGSPIDSYLNDGTNYKIKLDSYTNEYEQIKAKAENIIKKISELRAKLGSLTYENYGTVSIQIDNEYKALDALYIDFKNTNGKVVDKVSAFLSLEDEILLSRAGAYAKYYCKEIQKKSDDYAAKVNTAHDFSTHRSNLKTITSNAKDAINDAIDENKTLEQNLKNLLTEYNGAIKELDGFYNSYLFDYEMYSANQKLAELSSAYTDVAFLEKRDQIISKAKNDIAALSKATTIEKYSKAISEILTKTENSLKSSADAN